MPKFSGPRMRSGAYYSKGKKRGRRPLSKAARSEVRKIAKKEDAKSTESKYFNTNPNLDQTASASAWRQSSEVQSEVAVYGYTTGLNRARIDNGDTVTQTIYKYGVNTATGAEVDMLSLDLNKCFASGNSLPTRSSQSVEGTQCRPHFNEVQWLLNRVQGDVTANKDNGLVYKVRMIRVSPNVKKGTYITIDPKMDLFLDQYNEHFGIQTVKSSVNVFTQFECMLAKVNTRRYKVISDKMFTIKPSNLAILDSVYTVPVVNDGLKKIRTRHKIGKKFYYENPNDPDASKFNQYPTTGFKNEFILFHVVALGNPNVSVNDRVTPGLLNITARPVSTFKDN